MEIFITFFKVALYEPLFNALVLLYQYLPGHDFGIAVIVLTVIIRLVLYPLMVQSIRSQKVLQELQPKIEEIKNKYQKEKDKQAREIMQLYQKEKINPFGGCLPLLLQLPILIALYQVFWRGFKPDTMHHLYSFVSNPGIIDSSFLGILDLSQASVVLALIAGLTQFFQSKMMMPHYAGQQNKKPSPKKNLDFSQMMQKQMLYFFPFLTVFILWRLPSAIGLYWIVTALFSILQQYLILRPKTQPNPEQTLK